MTATEVPPEWLQIHRQATLVDLHAHPTLKALAYRRCLRKPLWVPSAWAGSLNPFTVQTSFGKLDEGGVDVLLSTIYPLEKAIFTDIKAFRLIPLRYIRYLPFSVAQHLWHGVVEPPYFDVTTMMMDAIEEEMGKYDHKLETEPIEPLPRSVRLARSGAELKQMLASSDRPIILIHSIEGGHALEGPVGLKHVDERWTSLDPETREQIEGEILANLETLIQRGVAYIMPAHFYPNRLMMSTFPYPEHEALSHLTRETFDRIWGKVDLTEGATELGKEVVRRMIAAGVLIDVTHASPKARREVYEIVEQSGSTRPCVVATHVGAYAVNPSPYNLEDWEIRWIADHGGVVGVIFMTYWLMASATKWGVNSISNTIEHLVKVGGEDVVGIGTDFDGADPPDDLVDSKEMPRLTQRLIAEYTAEGQRKYTNTQIEKFLGGNALRVLLAGWGVPGDN